MRVLHLTTEFPPVIYGGLGTALGGLAFASARAGMTVGVLLAGEMGRAGYAGEDSHLAEQSGGEDRVQAVTRRGGGRSEREMALAARRREDAQGLPRSRA